MKPWIVERLLWMVSIAATLVTILQVVAGSRQSSSSRAALPDVQGVFMYDAARLSETADSVVSSDPFRLDPHQSVPASNPAVNPIGPPSPSPIQNFAMTGLSGGPPWRAIVSGIPGHEGGVVVHAGDTLGGIRIRAIRRDTVVVETRDSAVTFTLKR